MQPPDWLSLALQADQLLTQDRLADAAEQARRSLALHPDCAVAHHVRGRISYGRHGSVGGQIGSGEEATAT